MTFQRISEEEHDCKLATPHDPPTEARCSQIEDEYYRLYSPLSEYMETIGENDAYGQGDYNLDPAVSDSRGLSLEVNNEAIVSNTLVERIAKLIQEYAPRWEVYIRSPNYDWGVFVSTSEAWIFKESEDLLRNLQEV